jgi:hypothetical protein
VKRKSQALPVIANPCRHCERSEAIHLSFLGNMDCFASYAASTAFFTACGKAIKRNEAFG